MSRVAIVTDSNSGITQMEGKALGISVLPMPFYINEEMFLEDITLSQEEFYEKLENDADIKTSQPTPGSVLELWDELLKDYDEIIHIPMSSGLSSSCETSIMLSQDYDGKVQVADIKRISVTQRRAVLEAMELVKQGKSAKEIKDLLEAAKYDSDIYVTLETLKYLKKGGRLTPAAAAIGTVLNLKPVLRIKGDKLDAFSKTRGLKAAKKTMIKTVQSVIENDFSHCGPNDYYIDAAYTGTAEDAAEWKAELEEAFPGHEIFIAPLALSVACHIGPGAKAVTVTQKLSAHKE